MSRSVKCAVWLGLVAMLSVGCSPVSLMYFLFRGDQKAPAEYPLLPKNDKKEVTVALMISAPHVSWEFAGIERDLASALGRRMQDQTKDGKHPIKVIDQSTLDRFKSKKPEWRSLSTMEIGQELGADYVIDLTLENIMLYEAGTGKLMYQGQATAEAMVYDVAAGQEHAHYFVNPRMESRPSSDMLMAQYKTKLLERLADEISWKHVAHAREQQIAPSLR